MWVCTKLQFCCADIDGIYNFLKKYYHPVIEVTAICVCDDIAVFQIEHEGITDTVVFEQFTIWH